MFENCVTVKVLRCVLKPINQESHFHSILVGSDRCNYVSVIKTATVMDKARRSLHLGMKCMFTGVNS